MPGWSGRGTSRTNTPPDWSYDLLNKSERRLFERLAVFAGEAAEAVGIGVDVALDDVLDLLAGLVRKSLVVASEAADGT